MAGHPTVGLLSTTISVPGVDSVPRNTDAQNTNDKQNSISSQHPTGTSVWKRGKGSILYRYYVKKANLLGTLLANSPKFTKKTCRRTGGLTHCGTRKSKQSRERFPPGTARLTANKTASTIELLQHPSVSEQSENRTKSPTRLHACRTFSGHCDHRNVNRLAFARCSGGTRSSAADAVYQQYETVGIGFT